MPDGGIAAGVGAGIDEGTFRGASAWAWMWRSFDLSLPDVSGAADLAGPVASWAPLAARAPRRPPGPSEEE